MRHLDYSLNVEARISILYGGSMIIARVSALVVTVTLAASVMVGATQTASAAPSQAPCPSGETISVTAPSAAASTTVSVAVTPPVNLKPAASGDSASYHLHYFVDIDPSTVVSAGKPVPTGNPKIIHSASTSQDLGALSAGNHTVWVLLGDVSHLVCDPVVQGSVSFNVAAGALPATGTSGAPAAGVNGSAIWLILAGTVAAGAGLALRRTAR